MKKLIAMLLCIGLVLSLGTLAIAAEPATEILKGTPIVDGKLDGLYESSYSFKINNKDFASLAAKEDSDNLEATVYFLHDGEWLYICAVVTGDSDIIDTNKSWPLDGVDVWFLTPAAPSDPTRTKITLEAFASPSGEFNSGDYENSLNVDMAKVENAATQDPANKSYITEAKLPIPYASESEGTIVINVQLNNAYSNGGFGSYGEQFGGSPDTIVLSDTAAVEPEPVVLPEILKGAPVVDGKLDGLYESSYSFKINNKDFASLAAKEDSDNLEATVYFLHDGEWLYICAVVTGDSDIIDTNKSWPLDGVDVWFLTPAAPSDPTRTKITLEAFASPSGEFNSGDYENSLNVDMAKVENAATQDPANKSYITEAKLPIPYASESEGTIVINVQLNNAYSNGGFGSYGEQFGGSPDTIVLSDTAAKAPAADDTGDMIGVVVALLAVSGTAITVLKKKEF